MFVSLPPNRSRRKLRLPPTLVAGVAVFLIALSTMAQNKKSPPPATPINITIAAAAPEPSPAAPATSAPATPAPADAASDDPISRGKDKVGVVWDLFRKGGPVMWVLAAASVLALAIVFERLYALRRGRVIPSKFLPALGRIMDLPDHHRAAIEYCKRDDSPLARMVVAFFKRLPRGLTSAEKALEDAGANEALKLRANLRMLYAIGSTATLLGLIGTIAGMIKAFMRTADPTIPEGMDRVKLLSEGIYEAMVCTFGGLAVAILVTVFYYYFVGKVEKLIGDINDEIGRFSDEYGRRRNEEVRMMSDE